MLNKGFPRTPSVLFFFIGNQKDKKSATCIKYNKYFYIIGKTCRTFMIEGESTMRTGNYNCFSYKLKEYLFQNGLEPIHEMIHSTTNRTFWIFERNHELDILLDNWTNKTNL